MEASEGAAETLSASADIPAADGAAASAGIAAETLAASAGIPATDGAAETLSESAGLSVAASQVIVWLGVLFLLYLVLQTLLKFFGSGSRKRRSLGKSILLLGQCNAGKTEIFYRLRDGEEATYVSSLKVNRDSMQIKVGSDESDVIGPVEVIDFPGHQRLRTKAAEVIPEARCIVYVVDADDKQKLKDVAEHLYELLTCRDICELQTPILLAINKTDLMGARADKFILEELDREIEQMRVSRAATLEGQDQADSYLGVDGEKFKLLEHAPCSVTTCRISAKKRNLQPLLDLLRQHFA